MRGLDGALIPGPGKIIAVGRTLKEEYLGQLRAAVGDVVARQRDPGVDLVNDGEFGHSTGMKV